MAQQSEKKKVVPGDLPPPSSHFRVTSTFMSSLPFSVAGLSLLVAAVAFFVYWPSLKSDFVYDARYEILTEKFVTSPSNLPAVLSFKVLGMSIMLGDRPGLILYLMANAALWGQDPWGYHLGSNLLHAANVALVLILLLRLAATEATGKIRNELGKVQLFAVLVALLFALHPVAVESVSEVSYSSSLLVVSFTLLALLAATAFRADDFRTAMWAGGAGVFCSFASVACKESGLATALLLVVYWFLYRRGEAKRPWFWFLGVATAIMFIFLAARFYFAPPSPYRLHYLGGSFSHVFLIQPQWWVFMMGKLVWPTGLSADYTMQNLGALTTPIALAILISVVGLQAWLAVRSRLGALGMAVYWLGLATVSNFVPLNRVVADRFYYLPLVGVAMELLALLLMTLKLRRGFWLATAPGLVALAPLTFLNLKHQRVFTNDYVLWTETLKVSPTSWQGHDDLGVVLLQAGRVDEAMAEYRKAIVIEPGYFVAHYNLGNALLQKGRVDEAMAEYRRVLEIYSRYAPAHDNLGNAFLRKGQVDEAMAEYQKAVATDPTLASAHCNLGNILLQKGRENEALVQYRKAVEIDPDLDQAQTCLGNILLKRGQIQEALGHYQKAVEINPGVAGTHNELATLFLQMGRTDEAIAEYRKTLALNPQFPQARYNLGMAFNQKGNVDAAMTEFQKAVDLDPTDTEAHNNFGLALAQKGQADAAMAQFQKAVDLDPKNAEARTNLGNVHFQKGQWDQAIVQYQEALKIIPADPQVHNILGLALAQKGQMDAAIVQFQAAVRLKPDDTEAQANLAKAQAMTKQAHEAK